MGTLTLVLSCIASILKIAEHAVEKMTPDQVQGFIERHERRMAFWEGLVERFTKSGAVYEER